MSSEQAVAQRLEESSEGKCFFKNWPLFRQRKILELTFVLGVLCSRENIRRQLASDEKEEPELTSNNLLLCFLNDTPSDFESEEEEEIEIEEPKPPPNHPLAQLKSANGGWQSDDSSSEDESLKLTTSKTHQNISLERVNSSRSVIEGNISRKKGHVIIPLRCSSEAVQVLEPPSSPTPPSTPTAADSQLEDAFFQQLAVIQVMFSRFYAPSALCILVHCGVLYIFAH